MKRYQTGSVNILAITVGISVILLLAMGIALRFMYSDNQELVKKNGELVTKVQTVTDENTKLNGQIELSKNLTDNSTKESEVHEKVVVEIKKDTTVQIRKLPKPIVKEKDSKPTAEQNANTVKRLDVLWVAYCSQDNSELCKTELTPENGKA